MNDRAKDARLWLGMLRGLGVGPIEVGGISLFRIPSSALREYRGLTGPALETRADAAQFNELLYAANQYVIEGHDLKALSPSEVARLKLLPSERVRSDNDGSAVNGDLWLGPWGADEVAVGIVGSYQSLEGVIARYRPFAAQIYYPYPRPLKTLANRDLLMRKLVMVFDIQGLARAAPERLAP